MTQRKAAIAYGGDISLSHDVLVSSKVMLVNDKPALIEAKIVTSYTRKDSISCTMKSDRIKTYDLAGYLLKQLLQHPAGYVCLDFDESIVHWSGAKMNAMKLGVMLGFFSGISHSAGRSVIFASPLKVRQFLGLKRGNASKLEVVQAADHAISGFKSVYHQMIGSLDDEDGDAVDALILSTLGGIIALGLDNGGNR